MKKKNLALLLIMPFLVALFGIATIKTAFNVIDNDVVRINWEYKDNELFELNRSYELTASSVVADSRYPASEGNRLVWEVENADDDPEPHATVDTDGHDKWFLRGISTGKVTITCTTEKRNVTPMTMTGIIYTGDAFVINTEVSGSGQNVDPTIYFGEYDLYGDTKSQAVIKFDITASVDTIMDGLAVDYENTTDNVEVDLANKTIKIKNAGEEMSNVTIVNESLGISTSFPFKIVKDGINVYTYEDLMYCTNASEEGEIAVLRRNFESKANAEASKANNVTIFGTDKDSGFNFNEEVYKFDTTYNSEYIDHWNEFVKTETKYKPVEKTLIAGIRVQKDFYGNGYTINLHNLCFPTKYTSIDGENYYEPGENDLFKGPKPFYLLGDPNNMPLVTAFGQDNVGMYVDGDNITVNDVKVKNCDFGLIVQNLDSTGTVLEVHGDNDKIVNSVLSNGKNVVRSFSSNNLKIENCILSTARNFLLMVGSNKYEKNPDEAQHTFTKLNGETVTCTIDEYLESDGDKLLGYFIAGFADPGTLLGIVLGEGGTLPTYPKETVKAALHSLQKALARSDKISESDVDGSADVKDTIFYRSGVASIGVDTMFNGPFLYNNKPSMIETILSLGALAGMFDQIVPTFPPNVAGSSYPVTVNISGNTRFFDYKTLNDWDISGLIDQNISELVKSLDLGRDFDITIDDIFPLKAILTDVAKKNNYIYTAGGSEYLNIPVAFYGGGVNLSKVTETELLTSGLTEIKDVDLLDSYLELNTAPEWGKLGSLLGGGGSLSDIVSDSAFIQYIKEVLTKTVTTVTGFEAFKFQFMTIPDGLFDTESGKPLTPDYKDLLKKA